MSQASVQYHAFIQEILQHQKVWAIKDEQGFPTSTNLSGVPGYCARCSL